MSYVEITKRIHDLLKVTFPNGKAKLQFKVEYFDDGTCVVSALEPNSYGEMLHFRGTGADPDAAAAKMFENFTKYLGDLEATQAALLADFTAKQTKHLANIAEARKQASGG